MKNERERRNLAAEPLTREERDGALVLQLPEKVLTENQVQAIGVELDRIALAEETTRVTIDLGNTRFLVSSALGKFIRFDRLLRKRGREPCQIVNVRPEIYEIFTITNMHRHLDIRKQETNEENIATNLPADVEGGRDQVTGNFHEVHPVQCPCGDSHRIKLSQAGWGFDTHLTKIRGQADAHQHKNTPETYFIHKVHSPSQMTVGDRVINLEEGMLIAVPNGTMHSVTGNVDVFIYVGGGHKDDDFFDEQWKPLT